MPAGAIRLFVPLESLADERGEVLRGDHPELELLRAAPEGLVGVVEEPFHHAPLAAEIDVRDLGLRLEDGAHQGREVRVELDHLLELVEHDADAPVSLRRELGRKLEELLERRVDVLGCVAGSEAEPEGSVRRVDRHHGGDPQASEDLRRSLARRGRAVWRSPRKSTAPASPPAAPLSPQSSDRPVRRAPSLQPVVGLRARRATTSRIAEVRR